MRLLATTRLRPGFKLAKDIPNRGSVGAPLLRAGATLSESFIGSLKREGINAVYIDDSLSEGIDIVDPLRDETRRQASAVVQKLFTVDPKLAGRPIADSVVADLSHIAALIAADIAASTAAVYAFSDLASADSYTHQHSLNVTVIGLMLAKQMFETTGWTDYRDVRRFDKIDEKLTRIGLGLLLHDVGKLAIPHSILYKDGRLTPDEWEVIREHPVIGVQMLECDIISPLVKGVVRSHHERWDGTGYPDGLSGTDIFYFARIAAVADVFDAITSDRPYAESQAIHLGVSEIRQLRGTSFDPEVVDAFDKVVAPFPPGSEIRLADGSRAIVVSVNPNYLSLPRVRVFTAPDDSAIEPNEIELLMHPELAPSLTDSHLSAVG